MNAAPLHFAGERLMLDPAGALYWPAREMLVVSDLHLEKGSSFARRGMLLPPWDTRATIDRLMVLLRHWRPRVLVALGDSFHDDGGVGAPAGGGGGAARRHRRRAAPDLGARQPRPNAARGARRGIGR